VQRSEALEESVNGRFLPRGETDFSISSTLATQKCTFKLPVGFLIGFAES